MDNKYIDFGKGMEYVKQIADPDVVIINTTYEGKGETVSVNLTELLEKLTEKNINRVTMFAKGLLKAQDKEGGYCHMMKLRMTETYCKVLRHFI